MQAVSGTSIDQASGANLEETSVYPENLPQVAPEVEPPRESFLKKILTAPTGSGSIGEYIDHPLNYNGHRGTARIIRGATGIFGNLDLAIIDIAFGLLEFMKPKKPPGAMNNASGV